jgi:hypothetical protein
MGQEIQRHLEIDGIVKASTHVDWNFVRRPGAAIYDQNRKQSIQAVTHEQKYHITMMIMIPYYNKRHWNNVYPTHIPGK